MSVKAKKDEINFNYPIPKSLHTKVKLASIRTGVKIKDIVIQGLMLWLERLEKIEKLEKAEDAMKNDDYDDLGDDL